ncbi:hypothetical protein ACROYT_G032222 [Oculina patagonica]
MLRLFCGKLLSVFSNGEVYSDGRKVWTRRRKAVEIRKRTRGERGKTSERKRTQQEEKEERRRQQAEERDEKRRQEEDEREARRQERDLRKMEREVELLRQREAIEAAKRQHELDLARLAGDGHFPAQPNNNKEERAKTPKLPSFVDGKDDLDAYLQRFERFATNAKWEKNGWATKLSALLTGRALDVYSRLSEEAATDYDKMKLALMKRYDLTEDGYRHKFRVSKPEIDESPDQFVVRLSTYLMRWVELSKTTKSFDGLRDLIVKEQFINSCPKELAIHLRERAPETLEQISQIADQYLQAHGKHVFSSGRSRPPAPPQKDDDAKKPPIHPSQCGRQGHEARNCQVSLKVNLPKAGGSSKPRVPAAPRDQVSAGCLVQPPQLNATPEEVKSCIEEDQLLLACGKRIPLLSNACVEPLTGARSKMPVVKGRVGEKTVDVLRDTGCSGIVVKKELVSEEQYTGDFNCMLLIDNTVRKVPIAKITVDTPYLSGEVEAQCLPNAIYDLIVGNVPGARAADDPDPSWQEACAVTTRGQAKKAGEHTPLKVPSSSESPIVDREKLMQLQREDASLKKYWDRDDTRVKGQAEISFERKSGVLYRVYKHPYVNSGKPVRQVLVPTPLRRQIMDVAHGSIMGGHMGIKKTADKIQAAFYWPGIQGDVTRHCKSCDVCQKTVPKGSVPKVPLEKMPIIDKPFKRVAIDLIGPISPPSEEGHRYILTLVDYATRYPEAVPLKNIDTETVAEALVDIFSRLGVPEEILSDLGTQFVSECMKEVMRLLSIKQLTTTPYHPMCNGMTEKFNGSLKLMLKRLCSEQPKQWHRYINPLLFAYREVPQESTGFAPFELLYGRAVRGPMYILKELWTKEVEEPEVKNSYQYVFELREKLEDTLNLAHSELQKSQQKGKHYYDRKTKVRKLQPGDKVLVLLPTDHNKLLMQWKGPFEVSAVVGLNDYKVKVKGKERVYHVNLLKKYFEREEPAEVSAVAIEAETEETEVEADFLEIGGYVPKESIHDVTTGPNLRIDQRDEFMDLAHQFSSLFTEAPGTTNLVQHHIKLTSEEPVRSKPYPVPYSLRESLKEDINDMIKMGVVRESNSPYSSPVVVVKKKDGTNRVCVDYRKLNKLTVFDPEPMPTAEELFQKLNGDKYFSKIDLSKGYWQITIPEEDIPKTAFVTPDGLYEFLKMPFGMVNSAATLKRAMKRLLKDLPNVEFYWDDILVHTRTWEEHLEALRELFKRLLQFGMTVRPSKCIFGVDSVEFLGHQLQCGLVGLHEDNVAKIRDAPRPSTKKQIRSFMGLAGYYRDFIPNFAAVVAPLSDLTRKGQPNRVEWGEAQERAYQSVKAHLTSTPILHLPDPSKTYYLRTDASDNGIGAVLMQEHEGKLFPVCYASKKLSNAERNYSTIEKECLAIVWGIKRFHLYLYGVRFVLQTDHEPLKYMNSAKFVNSRLMRWTIFLQSYNLKVEAIKGSDNVGADYLSRVVK